MSDTQDGSETTKKTSWYADQEMQQDDFLPQSRLRYVRTEKYNIRRKNIAHLLDGEYNMIKVRFAK